MTADTRAPEHFDLLVHGGIVVDGTGLARRRADVGVRSGRIAAVGRLEGATADEVIDATGLIVAPGIVDAHTHYDPQLTFEPYATSSPYHGVTTVVAGNCGFSLAPTRADDHDFTTRLFAKVEGMSPVALSGVTWDFETFPEYLDAREGKLGVNLACYIGHSSVRRFVMGADASERAATASEVGAMCALVRDAMQAGACGFSSSHAPTQLDGDNRPVPSRSSDLDELRALVAAAGESSGGSVSYLPQSAVNGIDEADKELLIELGLDSSLPIIIQGLGGRSKVDAPTAGWPDAKAFLEDAASRGAAVFSLLMTQPFDRPFNLRAGTSLYDGVPAWREWFALDPDARRAALDDPATRDAMRDAVEHPNKDPDRGSTLPPPHWNVVIVNAVTDPVHEKFLQRPVADIAAELGVAPADAMLDLAASEDLATEFRWSSETAEWRDAVAECQTHPNLIVGVSDGGAHLDRQDGAEWSTTFLRTWVLERKVWSLEEGIRQITQVPAALCAIPDRGTLLPGFWADMVIFDPDAIAIASKAVVHDFPGGDGRWSARPVGFAATIVNGVPIVRDGELTGALPGAVVRPVRERNAQ
ncbi:MAG: N-acyl-D-amino-acid deacylase [Actinomycetia bacterium]|nr:N-acyl-D-amino-acid deacylase [Actinomycetes bacterium]